MSEDARIRIDKFLWAVRLYKTRSIASEECRKGRISINNIPAKPSHTISADSLVTVRKLPVTYTYQVIKPVENRVPAKMVQEFIKDITPEEEKTKLILSRSAGFGTRPRGLGRPTKKERRSIDRLNDSGFDV